MGKVVQRTTWTTRSPSPVRTASRASWTTSSTAPPAPRRAFSPHPNPTAPLVPVGHQAPAHMQKMNYNAPAPIPQGYSYVLPQQSMIAPQPATYAPQTVLDQSLPQSGLDRTIPCMPVAPTFAVNRMNPDLVLEPSSTNFAGEAAALAEALEWEISQINAGHHSAPRADGDVGNHFASLISSLEARVDLMAQMQHTRAQIERHAWSAQGSHTDGLSAASDSGVGDTGVQTLSTAPSSSMALDDLRQRISTMVEAVPSDQYLWSHVKEQRSCLLKLVNQLREMKSHLGSFQNMNRSAVVQQVTPSASEGKLGTLDADSALDNTQLQVTQVSLPTLEHTAPLGKDAHAPVASVRLQLQDALNTAIAHDARVQELQKQLHKERERQKLTSQRWETERSRLLEELEVVRSTPEARRSNVSAQGAASPVLLPCPEDNDIGTEQRPLVSLPLAAFENYAPSTVPIGGKLPPLTAPFSQSVRGTNIELSQGGFCARRIRGCRQSVVLGTQPLERQEQGWYFEVIVKETVNGWVGGLGIGVTTNKPSDLKRVPDKAWRMPSTFIVGYWGCVFLDGRERRTRWRADSLTQGQRVGLLVTGDGRGDLIVFVDGLPVVRADGAVPSGLSSAEFLHPVVDVFAATLSVELQQRAQPPSPPWSRDPTPPGSPASVTRSLCSSAFSRAAVSTPSSLVP